MKKFVALLNDGSYINIPATRMEKAENAIIVFNGQEMVAYVDTSAIISAHIS